MKKVSLALVFLAFGGVVTTSVFAQDGSVDTSAADYKLTIKNDSNINLFLQKDGTHATPEVKAGHEKTFDQNNLNPNWYHNINIQYQVSDKYYKQNFVSLMNSGSNYLASAKNSVRQCATGLAQLKATLKSGDVDDGKYMVSYKKGEGGSDNCSNQQCIIKQTGSPKDHPKHVTLKFTGGACS